MCLQWLDDTASSRSLSAADSQSQGRDISVLVHQHPLSPEWLMSYSVTGTSGSLGDFVLLNRIISNDIVKAGSLIKAGSVHF